MKIHDSNSLFRHEYPQTMMCHENALHCCRTGLLTERSELKTALLRSLRSAHLRLRHVRSLRLIETAITKKACDVAIVDIERSDRWPHMMFIDFDRIAADFPIIMLCNERSKALDYLRQAEHTADIFCYETINDPRFSSLVQAAKLRAEAKEGIDIGEDLEWMPLSAA